MRKHVAILLSLFVIIWGTACSKEEEEAVTTTGTQASKTTQNEKKVVTSGEKWSHSVYKEYLFEEDESLFEKNKELLALSGSMDSKIYGDVPVYKLKTDLVSKAVERVIVGNDIVLRSLISPMNNYQENTGKKLYIVSDEEARQEVLNYDYTTGVWINGQSSTFSLDTMVKEIEGVTFLNLTRIANMMELTLTKESGHVVVQTHFFPSLNQNAVVITGEQGEVVQDQYGNKVYAAFEDLDTGNIYAQLDVVKHTIGWEADIYDNGLEVWMDEICRPTEETVQIGVDKPISRVITLDDVELVPEEEEVEYFDEETEYEEVIEDEGSDELECTDDLN